METSSDALSTDGEYEFISMPVRARRAATEQSIISCKRLGSVTDGLAVRDSLGCPTL
jgi:hypothetical protein